MDILANHQAVEQLLSASAGGVVRLDQGMVLNERTHVARFRVLDGPPNFPVSVIAKGWRSWNEAIFDPGSDEPRSPADLLFNDWAGIQFLNRVMGNISPAPRFLAGDRGMGYFIMEDIGTGQTPADSLLGSDPAQAKKQMVELASSLGRMHAVTMGQMPEYERLRTGLGPSPRREIEFVRKLISRWHASLEQLGAPPHPGTERDLEQVQQALINPGPFLAYTHGDPCPDNWLNVDNRLRLIDFEIGGFRHALLDGVYGRIHFPTCWCVSRFLPEIPEAMEQAYRQELIKGCPAAADEDLFYGAVVEMCAFWILDTCEGHKDLADLMDSDGQWGISTQRQRVLVRAEIFTELTATHGHLQALGETVAGLAALLRRRWPAEADQMPMYPAFA